MLQMFQKNLEVKSSDGTESEFSSCFCDFLSIFKFSIFSSSFRHISSAFFNISSIFFGFPSVFGDFSLVFRNLSSASCNSSSIFFGFSWTFSSVFCDRVSVGLNPCSRTSKELSSELLLVLSLRKKIQTFNFENICWVVHNS